MEVTARGSTLKGFERILAHDIGPLDTESRLADSLSEPSLYEISGVAKDAPLKSIRSKCFKRILQYHPNRVKDDALKEQSMHESYRIRVAYGILSDESQRQRYDRKVDSAEQRMELANSSELMFPTSQMTSSEYRPQYRNTQYDEPLPPSRAPQTTPSRPQYYGETLPLPQSPSRPPWPPLRRLSVYWDYKITPSNPKAAKTPHYRVATAAQKGTDTPPNTEKNSYEYKENQEDILRKADSQQLANKGTFLGVEGFITGIKVHALADTGADNNFINEQFSRELHLRPVSFRSEGRPSFVLGHGGRVEAVGQVTLYWKFKDDKRKKYHLITFYVLPECIFDLMIGGSFLFKTATMTVNRHRLSRMPRPRMALSLRVVNLCGSPGRRLKGTLNLRGCSALPDSGAEPNILSYEYAKQRGWLPNIIPGPESCRLLLFADGSTKRTEGQLRLSWSFDDRWDISSPYEDSKTVVIFDVLYGCPHDVILGQGFLEETDAFTKHEEAFEDLYLDDTSGLFLVIWACDHYSLRKFKSKLSKKNKCTSKPAEESDLKRERSSEKESLEQELQCRAEADEKTLHAMHSQYRRDTTKTQERVQRSYMGIGYPSSASSANVCDSSGTPLPGSSASGRTVSSCSTDYPQTPERNDPNVLQGHRPKPTKALRKKKSLLDLSKVYISTASSVLLNTPLNSSAGPQNQPLVSG